MTPIDSAIVEFSVKLTTHPSEMTPADVERLRNRGLDDATIHDVVQVAALFNYYDRLADGMGIDPEPEWPPKPDNW